MHQQRQMLDATGSAILSLNLEGEIILRKAERRLNAKATLSENYRRGPNAIYSGLAAVAAYFFLKPLPIPHLLVIFLVFLLF